MVFIHRGRAGLGDNSGAGGDIKGYVGSARAGVSSDHRAKAVNQAAASEPHPVSSADYL